MKNFITAFLLTVLTSCSHSATKYPSEAADSSPVRADTATKQPEKGVIHASLQAASDPSVTYALYIPQNNSDKHLPLLLLFDPQGRGSAVITKYKDVAEKHQYILMASLTSKNGNSSTESQKIITALLNEADNIHADKERIYAGGFSGGGRVASLAPSIRNIKGILSIAAASPPAGKVSRYIAIAGKQDFNYAEVSQSASKAAAGVAVTLMYHNGIHEWCPAELFDQALTLFDADAYRTKQFTGDKKYFSKITADLKSEAGLAERTGDLLSAELLLRNAETIAEGVVSDPSIANTLKRITSSPLYHQKTKEYESLNKQQQQLTSQFLNKVGAPLDYWLSEMGKITAEMNTIKNSPRYFMLKRMIATLSIQVYMLCKQNIYIDDTNKSAYISDLYLIIDPDNKDPHYFASISAARKKDRSVMLKELEKSIELGFNDRKLVMSEPAFNSYLSDNDFNNLVNKIISSDTL